MASVGKAIERRSIAKILEAVKSGHVLIVSEPEHHHALLNKKAGWYRIKSESLPSEDNTRQPVRVYFEDVSAYDFVTGRIHEPIDKSEVNKDHFRNFWGRTAALPAERQELDGLRFAVEKAEEEFRQLLLYADIVIDRVAVRFDTREDAQKWFEEGQIPGFGGDTPKNLVKRGLAAQVISAIGAIEAGVYA